MVMVWVWVQIRRKMSGSGMWQASKQAEMGGGSIKSWNGVEPHEIIEASSSLIAGDSSPAS
jgi:hypothetical protein